MHATPPNRDQQIGRQVQIRDDTHDMKRREQLVGFVMCGEEVLICEEEESGGDKAGVGCDGPIQNR